MFWVNWLILTHHPLQMQNPDQQALISNMLRLLSAFQIWSLCHEFYGWSKITSRAWTCANADHGSPNWLENLRRSRGVVSLKHVFFLQPIAEFSKHEITWNRPFCKTWNSMKQSILLLNLWKSPTLGWAKSFSRPPCQPFGPTPRQTAAGRVAGPPTSLDKRPKSGG